MAPHVRESLNLDDDLWIVERDRARTGLEKSVLGAPEMRRYIAELANFNRIVFGNVLYGTVATVASVAFDLKEQTSITGAQVRDLLKGAPTPVL
jgi:hypothetical protein